MLFTLTFMVGIDPRFEFSGTHQWSNGVTPGQAHRLKLVTHQGDGRAGFALLGLRVLHAA